MTETRKIVDYARLSGLAYDAPGVLLPRLPEGLARARQVGADVVFDFGGGDALTVLNATLTRLENDLVVA